MLDHADAGDAIEGQPAQVTVVAKLHARAIAEPKFGDAAIGFVVLHATERDAERLRAAPRRRDDQRAPAAADVEKRHSGFERAACRST